MGGCATKPKVLKGEEGEAPEVDASAPTKDVVVEEGYEKNKKAENEKVDEAAAGNINKEIVEDEKVDGDQESKPPSLSNLLFKNEQGKDSTADESGPSEPVKEETKEESDTTTKLEAQKSGVSSTPELFVDAIDKDDTAEKITEAATTESSEKIIQEAATESEEAK